MTPFFFQEIRGKYTSLENDEARHCMKVMRKREGEDVIGIDGKGNMYRAQITGLGKKKVELKLLSQESDWGEKPQQITLLVSPLHKVDRFEWLIEKSVELGVNRILPYLGTHTVKTGFRSDRMERICIAALKQCLRSRLPDIGPVQSLEEALEEVEADLRLIAYGASSSPFHQYFDQVKTTDSIAILIGPEGDFDQHEINLAEEKGFQPVLLGQNRLRSETAAVHLLGLVKGAMGF